MVKPDPERDYYKDLGLENTADITEIKKQYRKLALKFHPDRNQANIEDATKQFQVIGEAHEVLSDPTSKQKYDVARAKKLQANRARYPTASGVRGNPWQDVGEQFPAPPRRSGMPPRSRPTSSHQHPTASQKYQNMFGGSSGPRGGSSRAEDESDDTYGAFDTFQRYRRSRKQAPTSNNSSSNSTPQKARPPPPETPPRAAPPPRTAAQKEKADAAFGSRRGKTGYQPASPAATDEPAVPRTNYFSSGRHTDLFANATANARREREEAGDKSQSAESMDEDTDDAPSGYRRQYGDNLDPRSAGPDIGRSRSTREPKRQSEETAYSRSRSASVPNSEDAKAQAAAQNGAEARFGSQVPRGASATGPTNNASSEPQEPIAGPGAANGQKPSSRKGEPSVFSFNVDDDMFKSASPPRNRFGSNSAEDVTTTFGNRDEGFNFSANGGAGAGAPKHRASSATRLGRKSPLKKSRSGIGAESIGRMYGRPEKADEGPAGSPNTAKFDPKEWTDKINPGIFNPPPTSAPSTSPSRGRSATMRKGKKPTYSSEDLGIHQQQSESGVTSPTAGEPHRGGSPMAMDIDSPPSDKAQQSASATARNIPVEPSRPDWRSGDHNGHKLNGEARHGTSVPGTPSKPPPAAAHPPGSKANPITLGSEDSDDLKASFADLRKTEPLRQPKPAGLDEWADIKTNLPFESRASTNVHLDTTSSSNLTIQTKQPDMNPPRAPRAPEILVSPVPSANSSQQSPREAWRCYMASFASYMEEWTRFDRRVINYLAEAQREMDEKQITGRGYGWLDVDRDDVIIRAYEVLETQVQEVRDRWAAAGAKHREAVRYMRLIRESVRKGSSMGLGV